MTAFLILFLAAATLLWLSIFGYLLILSILVRHRRATGLAPSDWPDIAVVVPTLNEEPLVLSKLRNLNQVDYPRERMTIVVVDGGSADSTASLVEQQIELGASIRLLRPDGIRGKACQLNHVLGLMRQEFIVVTDVDSLLEQGCLKALVGVLLQDPRTALVGAAVHPDTRLLEERIHWWLLNHLWWLEGEVLSSAIVPAPCYVLRRSAVLPLACNAIADDVHLALMASAQGFRVRLCRAARVVEVRVPRTPAEFVHFRLRRGAAYLRELLRSAPEAPAPLPWRIARLMRLWHLLISPKIAVGVAISACILAWTSHWHWPLLTVTAFLAPACLALGASRTLRRDCRHWWRLGFAGSRFLLLTWSALLAMRLQPAARAPYGSRG
jgi:cellulose synthase/poly-beta-1,6-N-acetylglucosamine synthase-like glycosyltransferase